MTVTSTDRVILGVDGSLGKHHRFARCRRAARYRHARLRVVRVRASITTVEAEDR